MASPENPRFVVATGERNLRKKMARLAASLIRRAFTLAVPAIGESVEAPAIRKFCRSHFQRIKGNPLSRPGANIFQLFSLCRLLKRDSCQKIPTRVARARHLNNREPLL